MAVNTRNLTRPVLQAIETWSSTQNHDLGYETQDQTSGKRYRYSKYNAGSTGLTPIAGAIGGPYVSGTDTTHTANNVTTDSSLSSLYRPTCVFRGTATSANCYGFVEVLEKGMATTALTSADQAVAQGDGISWSADWTTTAVLDSRAVVTCFGRVLDSHLASKDQAGSTLTATVTAVTIVPL
ncbi:MAG: hypothetical protein PHU85_11100 [Phycisphaerae bacterium]|nr:hypothetical protein [Phycisphaerae bacterium]